ncbi:hypothetical protein [Haladaptatus sp. CMSO5]|uniref:hypothetical protein n=1 Tax=Haladaptatus sp. CMSO5 TaxID=3120514 RepID=UPI002FCE5B67
MSLRQAIAFPRLIIVAGFFSIVSVSISIGMQVESTASPRLTQLGFALGTILLSIGLIHHAYTRLW